MNAPRIAFVADGAAVNWTIHKEHFSQMTGILDLMHALSHAWKVAKTLEDAAAYERYASWIWQEKVVKVIDELQGRGSSEKRGRKNRVVKIPYSAITY